MAYTGPGAGFCLATALFICGAAGFPVPPAQVPPSSGSLALGTSASSVFAPGAKVSLTGDGFAANASVTITIYSSPQILGHTVADASGHVATSATLPANLTGKHTLTALGNGLGNTGRALEASVDIKAVASASPSLASTGFGAAAWILGGIGMIIAGFALIRTAVFRRKLLPTV